MKFLKNLWARITRQELIDTLYQTINKNLQTIEELHSQEQEYKNQIRAKEQLITYYCNEISERDGEIDDLKSEIYSLQNENNICPQPDLEVDWDRFPYFGETLFSYYDIDTKKIVDTKIQMTPSKFYKIWSDEMYQYVITGMKTYSKKTELEKIVRLRDLVCDRVTYQFDTNSEGFKIDNWKLPIQTFANKKDDCDGMTSLWLTFCNIYGIPSNKVFNLTGTVPQGGHSFGGYLDQDNKMWIIECTSKMKPFLMKGSNYKCNTGISGITNWQFSGVPKVEQL
jgi:hypothetical protein